MPLLRGSVLPSLVKLGLTQNQALAYQALCQHGPQSANQLAKQLDILPNACYRLAKDLERSNLITISNSHPQVFTAINPSIALTSFIQKHQTDLDKLQTLAVNELAFKPPTSETQVDFLEHKNLFFNTYVKLANKAQEEILIISIGESVTDDILIANRDAIERGVSIKMIAHKYDHENQQLLKNHLKMGLLVRHFPDWGFHLVVVDQKHTLLSVNNPKQTDERIGFHISSLGFTKAMRDYFYSVWEKAQPIN